MTTPAFRIRNAYTDEFWTEQGAPLEFPTGASARAYRNLEVDRVLREEGIEISAEEAEVVRFA